MKSSGFKLSVEETAYAMSILGGNDIATGLMLALFGERPKLEMEGRLLAAGHSLVARGLLDLSHKSIRDRLSSELVEMLEVILQSETKFVRCSNVVDGIEDVMSVYRMGDAFLVQQVTDNVVYDLQQIASVNKLHERIIAFFGILSNPSLGLNDVRATFPVSVLEQLRELVHQGQNDKAVQLLLENNVPQKLVDDIVMDISIEHKRGSVICVESQSGKLKSEHGFLLLKTDERFWLFSLTQDDIPHLEVYKGNTDTFSRLMTELLRNI